MCVCLPGVRSFSLYAAEHSALWLGAAQASFPWKGALWKISNGKDFYNQQTTTRCAYSKWGWSNAKYGAAYVKHKVPVSKREG